MLNEKLGLHDMMFMYPYGKLANMTPERLMQVKAAGYACNCSAYGGINPSTVDRWDIRRQGIDDRFDISALRSRLFGFKRNVWL